MSRRKTVVPFVPVGLEAQRRAFLSVADDYGRHVSFGSDENADGIPEAHNMLGGWARATAVDPGAVLTFAHNLKLQATAVGTPNVAWPVVLFKHNGTGAPALGVHGGALSLVYEGGVVTSNSIQLVLRTAGTRTIDVANPVTALVFFTPIGNW